MVERRFKRKDGSILTGEINARILNDGRFVIFARDINIKEAIKIRDGFLAGKSGNEIQVWLILMFQLWWRRWM